MFPPASISGAAISITALALGACTEGAPPTGPHPTPAIFTLVTTQQWSGGTVRLRSSQADAGHADRLVLAGGDSLLARAIDDTTYSFTLPTGPSGPVGIRVPRSGGGTDSAGSVARVGFNSTEDMPNPYWSFSAWRPGGHPAILGTELGDELLVSFDLATAVVTTYPGLHSAGEFTYPVSITEDQTTVSTALGLDTVMVTQLYPTQSSGDRFEANYPRQAIPLGDSLYLATFHHSAVIRTLDNGRIVWSGRLEEPQKTIFSPDGRFAIVTASSSSGAPYGVPVFKVQTGESLFVAPIEHVGGAVFSPDGGVLYVVGGQKPEYDTLRAVNTATGATIATAILPDTAAGISLSLDAASGTLYVSAELQGAGELVVYDAATLAFRGQLPTGIDCGQFCEGTTLLDAPAHRLYMVGPTTQGAGLPSKVFIFDLLP